MTVKDLYNRLKFLINNKLVEEDDICYIASNNYDPMQLENIIAPKIKIKKENNKFLNTYLVFSNNKK